MVLSSNALLGNVFSIYNLLLIKQTLCVQKPWIYFVLLCKRELLTVHTLSFNILKICSDARHQSSLDPKVSSKTEIGNQYFPSDHSLT